MLRAWLVLALVLTVPACAASPPSPVGRAGSRAASPRVPIPVGAREVRRLARQHDRGGALRVLEPERPLLVGEPERAWLLVRLWPLQCEGIRARRAAASLPPSDIGDAVRARERKHADDRRGNTQPDKKNAGRHQFKRQEYRGQNKPVPGAQFGQIGC